MSTWDPTDRGTGRETSADGASDEGSRPWGRHPVDVGHLVLGLVFAGMVGIWALVTQDVVRSEDLRWLLPLPWVLGGGAGLAALAAGARRRARAEQERQTW